MSQSPQTRHPLRTKQVNRTNKTIVHTTSDPSYTCVVCNAFFTEDTADNLMVFCDRCNVAVHQGCYGYPLQQIPKGEWLCDACLSEDAKPECVLCATYGGAMKRTTCWRWCHLQCAIWIPEAFFRLPDSNECIDILQIQQSRFGHKCCFCEHSKGATMECCQANCNKRYHVICARKQNAYFEYRNNGKSVDVIFSMCLQHTNSYRKKMKLFKP
eukprot:315745_1